MAAVSSAARADMAPFPGRRARPRLRRSARVAVGAWATTALLGVVVAAAHVGGYRINTTASVPVGVWRLSPHAPITRGSVALWCPPDVNAFRIARMRGLLPEGRCPGGYRPLFKPIAAVGGDLVTVTPTAIRVNGVELPNSAQLERDGSGRPLPRVAAGQYRVSAGEVWFVSSYNPGSFDARYFGPVAASRIRGIVRPVLTRPVTQ